MKYKRLADDQIGYVYYGSFQVAWVKTTSIICLRISRNAKD